MRDPLHLLTRARDFGIAITPRQQVRLDVLTEERRQRRIDEVEDKELEELVLAEEHRRANPTKHQLPQVRADAAQPGDYLLTIEPVVVHREPGLEVVTNERGVSYLRESQPGAELDAYLSTPRGRDFAVMIDADAFERAPVETLCKALDFRGDFYSSVSAGGKAGPEAAVRAAGIVLQLLQSGPEELLERWVEHLPSSDRLSLEARRRLELRRVRPAERQDGVNVHLRAFWPSEDGPTPIGEQGVAPEAEAATPKAKPKAKTKTKPKAKAKAKTTNSPTAQEAI